MGSSAPYLDVLNQRCASSWQEFRLLVLETKRWSKRAGTHQQLPRHLESSPAPNPTLADMSTTGWSDMHILRDINGQLPLESDRPEFVGAAALSSRLEAFGNRRPSHRQSNFGRAAISPPPLRRQPDAAPDHSHRTQPLPTSFGRDSASSALHGVCDNSLGDDFSETALSMARHTTPPLPPPPSSHLSSEAPAINGTTPKAQTDSIADWTIPKIISQLNTCRQDVKEGHAKLTGYILESTKVTERRIRHGRDLFANVRTPVLTEKKSTTMRIKSKVTGLVSFCLPSSDGRVLTYPVIATPQGKARPARRTLYPDMHQNEQGPCPALPIPPRRNQKERPHSQHDADICATSARLGKF